MNDFKSIANGLHLKPEKFSKIQLIDHSDTLSPASAGTHDDSSGLPCTSCRVDDPKTAGSVTRGGFVTYLCTVTLDKGGTHAIRKRYSECLALRDQLSLEHPHVYTPHLPPKSYTQKTGRRFLESRRAGIELFLRTVVLNPELGRLPTVLDWLELQHTTDEPEVTP